MNRVEILRKYIDDILLNMEDKDERRCAYIHLYGVSQASVMIAMRRKEDPELAAMAGMLHDIYSYATMNTKDHAHHGAEMAKEILNKLGITDENETELICNAIYNHSEKGLVSTPFNEVLKDADVFQHCFYNPAIEVKKHEKHRYDKLKMEFNMI